MSSLRSYFVLFVCVSALGAAGCGGGASRPGPLAHHLDDMYIAAIPVAEKQSVINAQQDFHVARMEQAKAEADYGESATDIQVAQNELQQAMLDEKTANAKKASADKSADLNRINAATLLQREAKLARRAADKKLEYMKVRQSYLKKYLLVAEDEMYAKEARYELAKARLAQQKNIQPRGFNFANFQKQADDRAAYVQRTRGTLDRERTELSRREKEWKGLEQEARRSRMGGGVTGSAGRSTIDSGTPASGAGTTQEPAKTNSGAGQGKPGSNQGKQDSTDQGKQDNTGEPKLKDLGSGGGGQ